MIEIAYASSQEQLRHVRDLMREFVQWHRQRHREDLALIDAYFDAKAFAAEQAALPGNYAPPNGRLLLATYDGQPAGCVALRAIDTQACEMKRMFVYPQFQRKGVGHALAKALLAEARTIGYTCVRLDTSIRQAEAQRLYQRIGFTQTPPYYELPKQLADWLVFMELPL